MRLLATHITRYWYSGPVSMCHTEVHLHPRARKNQTILEFALDITPTPDSTLSREDYFGNEVTFFSIAEPHRELIITSRCLANVEASVPPALELSPAWEQVRDETSKHDAPETFEAVQFVFESPSVPVGVKFAEYATPSFPAGRPFLSGVEHLPAPDIHRVSLRSPRYYGGHSGGRSAAIAPRRLPGLRASDDRLLAIAETTRAVRQRLSAQRR